MTTKTNLNVQRLDTVSLRGLIGEADSLLFYGVGQAWRQTLPLLKRLAEEVDSEERRTRLKRICDWEMTASAEVYGRTGTTEDNFIKRQCKGTLMKFAFSAWKSENEGTHSMRLLFIVDSNLNHGDEYNVENMLSRTKRVYDHVSRGMMNCNVQPRNSEYRFLYKLFCDERIDPEIRAAVQRNTIFARLTIPFPLRKGFFEKVAAPWEDPMWEGELAKRRQGRVRARAAKQDDWRKELHSMAANYVIQAKTPLGCDIALLVAQFL